MLKCFLNGLILNEVMGLKLNLNLSDNVLSNILLNGLGPYHIAKNKTQNQ